MQVYLRRIPIIDLHVCAKGKPESITTDQLVVWPFAWSVCSFGGELASPRCGVSLRRGFRCRCCCRCRVSYRAGGGGGKGRASGRHRRSSPSSLLLLSVLLLSVLLLLLSLLTTTTTVVVLIFSTLDFGVPSVMEGHFKGGARTPLQLLCSALARSSIRPSIRRPFVRLSGGLRCAGLGCAAFLFFLSFLSSSDQTSKTTSSNSRSSAFLSSSPSPSCQQRRQQLSYSVE